MTFTTLISTGELESMLGDPSLVLLDARFSLDDEAWGTAAYGEAHIPGALRADLSAHLSGPVIDGVTGRRPFPDPEVFAAQLSAWGIDSSVQVVVYDADRGLMAAARVWVMLRWLGHDAVAVLDGGLTAWLAEDRPMTDEAGHLHPAGSRQPPRFRRRGRRRASRADLPGLRLPISRRLPRPRQVLRPGQGPHRRGWPRGAHRGPRRRRTFLAAR